MNELKEWLSNREITPRNIKELSELFIDLSESTVRGWVSKNVIPKKKEHREKLFQLTKIEKYETTSVKKDNINKVINSLYQLINNLDPIIINETLRDKFRNNINKTDIAYLSSLLEAILDENRFQLWSVFHNVKIKDVTKNARKNKL